MKNDFKSLETVMLNMADELSSLSKCVSHKVAAMIVKDGRILSSGVNGTPRNYLNCDQVFENYDPATQREQHKEFSDKTEIHAEMSAIINAAREGISINGATMYCTLEPCFQCIKNLAFSGIKRVVFRRFYDRNTEEIRRASGDFLKQNGISFIKE